MGTMARHLFTCFLSMFAHIRTCKSWACSLARVSNRICGVTAGACAREQRPSARLLKLNYSGYKGELSGGASGELLAMHVGKLCGHPCSYSS